MKKLVVLSVLLGLLVVAMPVMAVDLSYAGELTLGFILDGDNLGAEYANYWIDVDFAIDDFNTVKVEFEADDPNGGDWGLHWFYTYWTCDVGAALDLPLGVKLDTGYFRPQNEAFKVNSEYSTDRLRYRAFVNGMDLVVSYEDMVNFELAFDIATINPNDLAEDSDLFWIGAFGTVGPVSLEAYYHVNDPAGLTEVFLVGAKGGYDVMDDLNISAAANFAYNLADSPAAGDEWDLGVGVKGAYADLAALSVGMNGDDEDIVEELSFELNVTPIDNMGIDAGLVFNLAEAAVDTWEELDVSAWYTLGATKLRLGYFAYNEDVVAGGGLLEGGMFAWLTGGPLPTGSGGVYVVADVSF